MKDLDKSVATNLRATSFLIGMVEPLLRAGAGTALFFDDPRPGTAFSAAYGATKAGQIALARAWAAETVRTGPRVVIATPAPMPTACARAFIPAKTAAAWPTRRPRRRGFWMRPFPRAERRRVFTGR